MSEEIFADTSYYVALLLLDDAHHDKAAELTKEFSGQVVTTTWVMVELGNFYSGVKLRQGFAELAVALRESPQILITPPSDYDEGLAFFAAHKDKSWSLVDCLSFITMKRRGVTQAWTADRHFQQAGFDALLLP